VAREPIKVANWEADKSDIRDELEACRVHPKRRPRLSHAGNPPTVEIQDEWEVVPNDTWTMWDLRFGPK